MSINENDIEIVHISGQYKHPWGVTFDNPYVLYELGRPVVVEPKLEDIMVLLPFNLREAYSLGRKSIRLEPSNAA